jgi:hypothetical protein
MNQTALFITYTMIQPTVGGAFIRALRLATELARRGWHSVICNHGPALDDPKITAAVGLVNILQLDREQAGLTAQLAAAQFRSLEPAVIVMGESPIKPMELYFEAAKIVGVPLVVLDQFYNSWLLPSTNGVDLVLLYGLSTFWGSELFLPPPYEMTPPFIEAITPREQLPVPAELHERQWITLVAYDDYVCRKGIELMAGLKNNSSTLIAISHDPKLTAELARSADLPMQHFVSLPLQQDDVVFGFFGASAVVLVSNGFLQIMEVLAMGSPVIALERGTGMGMNSLNIDDRFVPYVSFGEEQPRQIQRVREWLEKNPLSEETRLRLHCERHGVSHCANRIEQIYRHRNARRSVRRTLWRWLGIILILPAILPCTPTL